MNNKLKPRHYFSRWTRIMPKYEKIMYQIYRIITLENENVDIIPKTNDIWVRDFMPFLRKDGMFVFYKYAPDYLRDGKEKYITDVEEAFESIYGDLNNFSCMIEYTNLVIDGGNIISCVDKEGRDCIIMTNKVFKENPQWSREDVIKELRRVFKGDIIFIPWDTEEEYGHADGMVRCIGDGKLLVNCYEDIDEKIDAMLKDILSPRFDIYQLKYGKHCSSNSWCHLNYLELNNSIIVPTAGIKSDEMALKQIGEYTGKRVIPLQMKQIIKEGGALHCISWTVKEPHLDVVKILGS